MPTSARPIAARRPAIPPPTTRARDTVWITSGSSASERRVFATPARTRPIAFSVAPTLSCPCAQESCSRTLTWV